MNWVNIYFHWKLYFEVIETLIPLVIIPGGLICLGILGIISLFQKHKRRKNK